MIIKGLIVYILAAFAITPGRTERPDIQAEVQKSKRSKAEKTENRQYPSAGNYADSPFGLFGPYEYRLNSKSAFSTEEINGHLQDIGIRWVQEMPSGVSQLPEEINIYSRVGREGGFRPLYGDIDRYKTDLRKALSTSLKKVKFIEIDTEPSGLRPPLGWRGYPREYAAFLKATYETIKSVRPDCLVVLGGIPGVGKGEADGSHVRFLREILDAGAAKYFDAFEFKLHHHNAGDYREIETKMRTYGNILSDYGLDINKIPVFLETAVHDGAPGYPNGHHLSSLDLQSQTETEQAVGLVKTFVFALAQGVDKIFWNQMVELYSFGGSNTNPFNCYGLINNKSNDGQSHKKLSYYTYKKLVETLEGCAWNKIQSIQESENIYIYKFSKGNKNIWVAWNDTGQARNVQISGIMSPQVKITSAVCEKKSGKEVKDYSQAFKQSLIQVDNHNITIKLLNCPLYIEQFP